LLSNKYYIAVVLFFSLFLYSCGNGDSDTVKVRPDYENPEVVLTEARRVLGEDIKFAYKGFFLPDTTVQIAAGEEIETDDVWGIKFYLLKLNKNNELEKEYESDLLEGSFRDAMIQKIKFPDFENELLYYNSQDYFLGSGGGEVFSYIVNFEDKEIYYAHLFSGTATGISLFLSENTGDNLRNFFVSNFKRDYPNLKLAARDVDLQ
jgi:hypothetical protein